MRKFALAGVVAANALVWTTAWWMTTTPAGTAAIVTPQAAERMRAAEAAGAGIEAGPDFAAPSQTHSLSQPLFHRSRQPWQPPAPAAPPPQPPPAPVARPAPQPVKPPAIRLVGVSAPARAAPRALLRREVEVDPVWVVEGDVLEGWTVSRIEPESVLLQLGRQTVSIELYPGVRVGQ